MDAVTADEVHATAADGAQAPAFAALFDAHFESMKRLAYLLGADDPENVAQEWFVRLHGRWSRLHDSAKALPYLRATVANLSRSRVRHLRVVRRAPVRASADEESAEATVLRAPGHGPLWTALEALTVRQRQVVVLRYWLDLPLSEVAGTLGVSVGTVKATLSQALAKLRGAAERGGVVMDALDARVRATLNELAEQVPASEGAWAEQERRQRTRARARRRRLTALTAAAVVVPLLAVGLTWTRSEPDDPPAVPPVMTDRSDALEIRSRPYVGPVRLIEYINGRHAAFWTYVKREQTASDRVVDTVCGAELGTKDSQLLSEAMTEIHASRDSKGSRMLSRALTMLQDCSSGPVRQDGPARIHPMASVICASGRTDVVIDCDGTGIVVVATAPEVHRLDVTAVGGTTVAAEELGRTDQLALFVAEFMDPGVPSHSMHEQKFTHIAYDADGTVIDQVTLSDKQVRSWRRRTATRASAPPCRQWRALPARRAHRRPAPAGSSRSPAA